MDFLDNPFSILNATPCDNDARIIDLAVAGGLFQDPARCREAKSILMSPRKRIHAEIAWLPVKNSEQAKIICELLESSIGNSGARDRLRQVQDVLARDELMPIAKCNVLAAGLHRLRRHSADEVATWTLEIARAFEDIDLEMVRTVINEDRQDAGFPIAHLPDIGEALHDNQAPYYRQVMTSAMDKLSAKERTEAMTRIVASASADDNQLPRLIIPLVAWYKEDGEVLKSLEEHETKIGNLDGQLRLAADANRPDSVLVPLVNQLIQEVKNWDVIAQPIQVSKTSQGLPQNESEALEERVRDLAMHLFDAHDKLNFCLQLIRTLQEAFAEVDEISNRLAVEMEHLTMTAQKRERCGHLNIESQVEKLREDVDRDTPDCTLRPMVDKLIQYVKKWKDLVKLCEEYYANFYIDQVAGHLLELALHLQNEYGKLDYSRQLFEMLQEEFAEIDQIAALVTEHLDALEAAESALAKSALEKIKRHVKRLSAVADVKNPDSNLDQMLNELIQSVKDWKSSAQPIEAYSTDYLNVVHLVVELAFQLRITHGKLDFSRLLFKRLQEVFSEDRGYATSIAEYSNALEEAERALGRITIQVKELRGTDVAEKPNLDLSRMVNQLIQDVKEWKDRAQPIKADYANYSKGAHLVKDLALDLQNEHGKLDNSRQLLKMLQQEFAEVDQIAALVAEHLDAPEAAESARRHIEIQVEGLRDDVYEKHYHPDLSPRVDQLIQAVKGWRDIAQPIKAYCGDYCNVAKRVLELKGNLENKGKLHYSRQLTEMLQDIFGEIPKIATLLAEDAKPRDETAKKSTHRSAKKRARRRGLR